MSDRLLQSVRQHGTPGGDMIPVPGNSLESLVSAAIRTCSQAQHGFLFQRGHEARPPPAMGGMQGLCLLDVPRHHRALPAGRLVPRQVRGEARWPCRRRPPALSSPGGRTRSRARGLPPESERAERRLKEIARRTRKATHTDPCSKAAMRISDHTSTSTQHGAQTPRETADRECPHDQTRHTHTDP